MDYRSVPIVECGEPLVPIPPGRFAFWEPHPYAAFGAPYQGASPWRLRQGVLAALAGAARALEARAPGWKLRLFDAWRPVEVQAFMVWREFRRQAARHGRTLDGIAGPEDLAGRDPEFHALLAATVFTFWGMPSLDPKTPPPHSTGAAVDLTLEDAGGREADMGCPIDETTERAFPDHYAGAADAGLRAIHSRRELLHAVMASAGFTRHRHEWWHFSLGDQMAALADGQPFAVYGRAPVR